MTLAELTKLEHALRGRTVLSIYVNGDVADAAARGQWRTELRNALDAIEESLEDATHAEREDFAATRTLALSEVDNFTPGEDSRGWVGFFTADEVHYAGVVPVPVPTQATWDQGANLGPSIRVLKEARPVLVVVADSSRVRIHRYADGTIALADSLDRELKLDAAYSMGRPAPQGFSSGTRGTPVSEVQQREMKHGTDVLLGEAASRIEELAGKDARVLVGGIPVVASALHGKLGHRLSARSAVVALDVHATDASLAESARENASRLRAVEDLERIEQVIAATAQGSTGVVGAKDTARALLNGQVRELFVTSAFVQAHPIEADEAIRRAFDVSATVEHMSGEAAAKLDSAGGIAARLRFTMADGTKAAS